MIASVQARNPLDSRDRAKNRRDSARLDEIVAVLKVHGIEIE
jgi:hypothetical protein